MKIIERAEQLDKVSDIIKASRDLNDLHRLWKNELGPVSREHSDDLWARFQAASQKFIQKDKSFKKISQLSRKIITKKSRMYYQDERINF
ncbi:MAG: hypothetical protein CM15mP102_07100 [Flavobacteriales bacterium]|nr:MAG: hypothetical protein CM15mP102_07100 [Flavobacteriales bacterium]